MSLYGSFALDKHFSELDNHYDSGTGAVMTPAQRRAAVLGNLYGDSVVRTPTPGTVTGNVTAEEFGDGVNHTTRLTFTAFAVGTSGDNASLAFGAKFYTFPAGKAVHVEKAVLRGGVTAAISVTTDTPEVGIGTVVATGAAATLTTATWENVMDGGATMGPTTGGDQVAVAPDVAGTVFSKVSLSTVGPMIKPTGGQARDLFLNIADGWADVTAAGAVTFTGVVVLDWKEINA